MLETLCMSGMSPRTYATQFPPGQNPDMAPGYCSPHTTPTLHPPPAAPSLWLCSAVGGGWGGGNWQELWLRVWH